ncbi:hypothetical protein BH10ACI2_BH10ACI2_00110 [soil metagenome]
MPKPGDMNIEETQFYFCGNCGERIEYRLPKGLKGVFTHVGCQEAFERFGLRRLDVRSTELAGRSGRGDL